METQANKLDKELKELQGRKHTLTQAEERSRSDSDALKQLSEEAATLIEDTREGGEKGTMKKRLTELVKLLRKMEISGGFREHAPGMGAGSFPLHSRCPYVEIGLSPVLTFTEPGVPGGIPSSASYGD